MKVFVDPSSKTANSGDTATVGGGLTHIVNAFEGTVFGMLALSVALSTKLHLPVSVWLVVVKVWLNVVAPSMGE